LASYFVRLLLSVLRIDYGHISLRTRSLSGVTAHFDLSGRPI
jgi:hypothetical protein